MCASVSIRKKGVREIILLASAAAVASADSSDDGGEEFSSGDYANLGACDYANIGGP